MIARSLAVSRGRPIVVAGAPSFALPDSQLVTAAQIYEPECRRWFSLLAAETVLDRKLWEYAFVLQAVHAYGRVGRDAKGISFGCGKEMLTSIFAAAGCDVTASDLVDQRHGWEAQGLEDLFVEHLIDRASFESRVRFRNVDMNSIPDDLVGFDFAWSTGSLEHIGGHQAGLDFVVSAMDCLKPGGIAVHTTEFAISTECFPRDDPTLSFYTRQDIENLASELLSRGHLIVLNFTRGDTAADHHVDVPPFHYGMTLAAHFGSHVVTSIGLIVQKNGVRSF